MKKRVLPFSMAICMVCLLTSCSAAEARADSAALTSEIETVFTDMPAGAWYAEAAAYCRQQGIMNGTTDTTFAPEATLTRAMLVTILWRQAQKPEVNSPMQFSDVPEGRWYSEAVRWAAAEKLVNGYGDGRFAPNDSITKRQLSLIFQRYAGQSVTGGIPGFDGSSKHATRAQTAAAVMNCARLSRRETGKVLVAYFSATGNTRSVAEKVAEVTGGDLFEIVPAQLYTAADLNYNTDCRANAEQNDPDARPAIASAVEDMEQYDAVLIGYPIWWGRAPKIIHTFLETYDLSGKTIATFCTSGSSPHEDASIRGYEPDAAWLEGRRFSGTSQVENWINGLDLPKSEEDHTVGAFNFDSKTVTLNSGCEMPLNGLGTYSLHGDTCVSSVKSALRSGVRLIDTASAYGNEEEVGQAIREAIDEGIIKREDIFVITKIYPGSEMAAPEQSIQACLDRLDIGYVDMMLLHHPDRNDVKAYRAMEKFVEDGKIRSIGLSNWYVKELEEFLPQVSTTPALVQNEIHPYYQENDVIPYIQDLGIVVQGWYPLGGRGHTAELLGDEVISGIAKAHGVSSAQVILRWNLQKGVVVIPGSSDPDHIRENTKLYHFALTDEEMAQINALDRNEKHDWY